MRVLLKRFFSKYVYYTISIILITVLCIYMDSTYIYSSIKLQLQESKTLFSIDVSCFSNLVLYIIISHYVIRYFLKDNTLRIMPIKKNDILNASYLIIFSYITFNIIVSSIFIYIILANKAINTITFTSILFYYCKREALMSIIIFSFIPLQIYNTINRDYYKFIYFGVIVIVDILISYSYENIKATLTINSYAIGICVIALLIGFISYKASSKAFSNYSLIS